MVLPDHWNAARITVPIEAWLNEGGDVNERDCQNHAHHFLVVKRPCVPATELAHCR